MPQSGFFLKKKPPSTKTVRTYVLENRSIGRWLAVYRVAVAANFFTIASSSLRSLSLRFVE
jgi:hypothetical protein